MNVRIACIAICLSAAALYVFGFILVVVGFGGWVHIEPRYLLNLYWSVCVALAIVIVLHVATLYWLGPMKKEPRRMWLLDSWMLCLAFFVIANSLWLSPPSAVEQRGEFWSIGSGKFSRATLADATHAEHAIWVNIRCVTPVALLFAGLWGRRAWNQLRNDRA